MMQRSSSSMMFAFAALVLCVLFVSFAPLSVHSFSHPGTLVSGAQLDYIKAQVASQSGPVYDAYVKAKKSQYGNYNYAAQGPPGDGVINCGSYSNPNYGCSADDDDSSTAYVQALLWAIEGDQRYAQNAIKLLNTYSSKLTTFANSNAPLQAAWSASKWPRAADIISHTGAGWAASDIAAFQNMLSTVHLPMIENGSGSNGNWELAMIEGMINIGVFTVNGSLFNRAVSFWRQRVPAYFYISADGSQPNKAPRGNPSWYGQTTFNSNTSGIAQETCRDFGHLQYGLASTLNIAETAYIQGTDLYSEEANRLTQAMEFHANLLMGAQVPWYVCGGAVTLVNAPTFEIGYNAYHNRMGYSLPNTENLINQKIRANPNPTDHHISIYETLTHAGAP